MVQDIQNSYIKEKVIAPYFIEVIISFIIAITLIVHYLWLNEIYDVILRLVLPVGSLYIINLELKEKTPSCLFFSNLATLIIYNMYSPIFRDTIGWEDIIISTYTFIIVIINVIDFIKEKIEYKNIKK